MIIQYIKININNSMYQKYKHIQNFKKYISTKE